MDLGQIFTQKYVAEYMISLFRLDKKSTLLDPCFGSGAFLDSAVKNGYLNIEGFEIDEVLYKTVKTNYPELTLFHQEFLTYESRKKYDGIVMNPPYIRHEKIDDLKNFGIRKETLRRNPIFQNLPNTANLYMYFIIKAVDLLIEGGELVVIFPSSWLQAKSGKMFEQTMYSACTLVEQIHIEGEVFEKSALVEVVILHLVKGVFPFTADLKNARISNGSIQFKDIVPNENKVSFSVPFSQIGSIRRGLTTGFNSMFINPKFEEKESKVHLAQIISTPKAFSGYVIRDLKPDTVFSPNKQYEFTPEIIEYLSKWKTIITENKEPKTLYAKITKNDKDWFFIKPVNSNGILFSYFVRNEMKFILNDSGFIVRDNFYIIKPKIDIMLAFSLLNNYYTFLQLEISGKKYGAGLLKLQGYDIEALKFPDIKSFNSLDIERLKELSSKLCITGDISIVDDITRIISKYSAISFEETVDNYLRVKKRRLEAYKYGKKSC